MVWLVGCDAEPLPLLAASQCAHQSAWFQPTQAQMTDNTADWSCCASADTRLCVDHTGEVLRCCQNSNLQVEPNLHSLCVYSVDTGGFFSDSYYSNIVYLETP